MGHWEAIVFQMILALYLAHSKQPANEKEAEEVLRASWRSREERRGNHRKKKNRIISVIFISSTFNSKGKMGGNV